MGIFNKAQLKAGQKAKPKTDCSAEGVRTKQEFREECDINVIVRRFNQSGQLPVNMQNLQPAFIDASGMGDFESAVQQVTAADQAFKALDPNLRARFNNNPVALVQFISDEKNRDEAVRLGLVPKKEEPTPAPTPVSAPAVAAPAALSTPTA